MARRRALKAGEGRRRICGLRTKLTCQKLAFLLTQAGAKCETEFHIRDFGPFSIEIANATKLLAATGVIDERKEPVGVSNTYVSTFKVGPTLTQPVKPLSARLQKILRNLEKYPTVDLEVAATIIFFQATGLRSDVAIRKTKELKPTKTSPQILKKVPAIAQSLRSA